MRTRTKMLDHIDARAGSLYLKKHTALNRASANPLSATTEPVKFVVRSVLMLPSQAFCPCVSAPLQTATALELVYPSGVFLWIPANISAEQLKTLIHL
jgi:hypothetical protein